MNTLNRIRARASITSVSKLRLGIIAVTVIAVTLAGALGLGRLGIGKEIYIAEFAQSAGLSTGDRVTVAGVQVGRVRGMRLAGDHVAVTLEIDDDLTLGTATKAAIKLTTLLGARYVELRPAGSEPLRDRRIPLSNTEVPYDLQSALQDATVTFEAVDARRIAESMTTLSAQLQQAPEVLPQALDNIEHLSKVIAGRRDQIYDLLRRTEQVAELLGDQQRSLGLLLHQSHEVLSDLVARKELVVRLIDATTRLVNQLRPVLIEDRGRIDELLANLDGMLSAVHRNDALLRNTLQILPVPVRNFANATGNGNEFDFTSTGGTMIDSFVCAISGRAKQFNLPPYFGDCR
ncbi:mce related family protein [Mycolicibacterium hassiacum DSM 44199]|jgi:virulence factor Mce-like protein|uniref:Mce related family protein n=1 Tax=Mycolicibacterium hassiacum (strain DSM 44199 / CIP 105218 / JCM 12690 / 3849) TaxID=1122247 RepID=K5BHP0_MYCHD|nr:MCE family protein [Mycolicibacterium hassiacum]EKF25031.1 mce related family protein [Mycolicibacterium hassiacum DSM 44199]MBX5488226.1 MCE family protein [Mycolicibacterium hassiacum]MDA4087939.1 mammalian cell entry protein [Mycolicibacterium hassiacum DSM 44199]PZN22471.1 MAG: MCE family protein [Mycolicibacterium hassiacum]VCT93228.1 Lipoprotein LprN [Mycolicibacterium hassiacum DSM 44199]